MKMESTNLRDIAWLVAQYQEVLYRRLVNAPANRVYSAEMMSMDLRVAENDDGKAICF